LFVDSSGNVNIGTTFAGFGNGSGIEIQRSTTATLRLTGNSGVGCEFYNTGSLASIQTRSSIPFTIQTNEQERLRITSDGKLGLGTSSPSSLLEVSSSTSDAILTLTGNVASGSNVAAVDFKRVTGTVNASIRSESSAANDAGALYLSTRPSGGSLTQRLYITPGGLVGIGTTGPRSALDVTGNIFASGGSQIQITGSAGSTGLQLIGQDSAESLIGTMSAQALAFRTDSSERARITSDGKFLVGTSSSSADTRVVIAGTSSGYSGAGLNLANTGSSPADGVALGLISFTDSNHGDAAIIRASRDGGTWTSGSSQPTRLMFSTTADGASSPTERMRIDNAGNISSFAASATPSYTIRNASTAGTSTVFIQGLYSASSTTSGGTASIYVFTNGDIQNTNNSYTALSDIKLKENVVDANSQWADIKALRVRNYNLKEGQTHKQIGLVAQEVEPISPGLVYETPDRDADGNDLGTTTKAVQYSVLYMKAVKALQEAMERIETLEAEVAALKGA
jgi:hypothetical protein